MPEPKKGRQTKQTDRWTKGQTDRQTDRQKMEEWQFLIRES